MVTLSARSISDTSEIFDFRNAMTLKTGSGIVKVIALRGKNGSSTVHNSIMQLMLVPVPVPYGIHLQNPHPMDANLAGSVTSLFATAVYARALARRSIKAVMLNAPQLGR